MGARSVLLVDDHPANREVFRTFLEYHGYRVREAEDGEAAVRKIAEEAPDLVTIHFPVPLADGTPLVEALKSNPATAAIPVLNVTARVLPEELREARQAGVDRNVKQPVPLDRFLAEVEALLVPGAAD